MLFEEKKLSVQQLLLLTRFVFSIKGLKTLQFWFKEFFFVKLQWTTFFFIRYDRIVANNFIWPRLKTLWKNVNNDVFTNTLLLMFLYVITPYKIPLLLYIITFSQCQMLLIIFVDTYVKSTLRKCYYIKKEGVFYKALLNKETSTIRYSSIHHCWHFSMNFYSLGQM